MLDFIIDYLTYAIVCFGVFFLLTFVAYFIITHRVCRTHRILQASAVLSFFLGLVAGVAMVAPGLPEEWPILFGLVFLILPYMVSRSVLRISRRRSACVVPVVVLLCLLPLIFLV